MELHNELTNKLTLRAILLRNSQVLIDSSFDPYLHNPFLDGQFRTSSEIPIRLQETTLADGQVIKNCGFIVSFEFRYIKRMEKDSKGALDGEEIFASIQAEILVDYFYSGESIPSEEDVAAWAQSAALVQAWPYWREYCHNMLLRTGLPVALMPMLLPEESDKS